MYLKDENERAKDIQGMVRGQVFCSIIYIEKGTKLSSYNEDGTKKAPKRNKYKADENAVDHRKGAKQQGDAGFFMTTIGNFTPAATFSQKWDPTQEYFVEYKLGTNSQKTTPAAEVLPEGKISFMSTHEIAVDDINSGADMLLSLGKAGDMTCTASVAAAKLEALYADKTGKPKKPFVCAIASADGVV